MTGLCWRRAFRCTWLNGMSDGSADRRLRSGDVDGSRGDQRDSCRNYARRETKLTNLYAVVAVAESLDLPVVMGTR